MIPIREIGVVTNQAAYISWSEDKLSLPQKLLDDEWTASLFRDDVAGIELVQRDITWAITTAGLEQETADQAKEYFLHRAHDLIFGEAMEEILSGKDEAEHEASFWNSIRKLVRDTISTVIQQTGADEKTMMKQVKAEQMMFGLMWKQQKEREKRYAE